MKEVESITRESDKDSNQSLIHVAIAFDQNYRQQMLALLSSIFFNRTSKTRGLKFHLIAPDVVDSERQLVEQYIISQGATSEFYNIDRESANGLLTTGKWTQAVYYRLLFPLLVPNDVRRVLYLDSDILVINDLTELFETEMQGFPVAAVYDVYVKAQPLIGISEGSYFNSGVLLIDVEKWNKLDVSAKVVSYIRTFPERVLFVDQCGLNAILKDHWKKLSYRYNVLYSYIPQGISKRALQAYLVDKVIIHFTLHRPWNFLCENRLRYLYWYYLERARVLGKGKIRYADFNIEKIPAWLKIRMVEFYCDHPRVQLIWRRMKNSGTQQ